jgi:hypothetical protein
VIPLWIAAAAAWFVVVAFAVVLVASIVTGRDPGPASESVAEEVDETLDEESGVD